MKKRLFLALLGLCLLPACSGGFFPAAEPLPTLFVVTPAPTAAATLTPTASETPAPTATETPSPTATPTLHPMSILAMRARSYPGGEIVTESEFERGDNYRSYYVHYPSDGLKIYAMMTVPDGAPPEGGWPAIVFNHGYIQPELYRTHELYLSYIDRLARAGYVVFRSDYRGHDRSEGEALGAYSDPGYTVDILNAVGSLRQHPGVNPGKIGMWGHSMGGFLTLRALVISPDIQAGVIWAGVVVSYPEMLYNWTRDPMFGPSPDEAVWRVGWIDTYGTPDQNPEFWAAVSANSYLADLSGPLQLHHGTGDEEVPLEFSLRLAEQVRAAGGTVELYTYEGDNHSIGLNRKYGMDRTIIFFDQFLK